MCSTATHPRSEASSCALMAGRCSLITPGRVMRATRRRSFRRTLSRFRDPLESSPWCSLARSTATMALPSKCARSPTIRSTAPLPSPSLIRPMGRHSRMSAAVRTRPAPAAAPAPPSPITRTKSTSSFSMAITPQPSRDCWPAEPPGDRATCAWDIPWSTSAWAMTRPCFPPRSPMSVLSSTARTTFSTRAPVCGAGLITPRCASLIS